MLKTMDALSDSLPEKFYMGGHSYGGYLSSLYASFRPERIEALFLISPVLESYKPETHDPYAYQDLFEPHRMNSKSEVDKNLEMKKND